MGDTRKPTVVYLTRTGLLEPLGRSQVFAYLAGLARDYRIVLVTCERRADRNDAERMEAAREDCAAVGIDWRPMPFELGPRPVSISRQLRRFVLEVNRERRQGPVLVHARSYLPALAALYVNRRHNLPFVFDMRALWPEELIMAGRLSRGSLAHRALQALERDALKRGEVVSLTHAAVDHLERQFEAELQDKPIHVIPTCADLDRFVPAPVPVGPPVFGCNGTVLSGWFRLDLMAAWFRAINELLPDALTEVVTKDDPAVVRRQLCAAGVSSDRLRIREAAPDQMPAVIQNQTASAMFFQGGIGKLGSCPTRMAEVLACGRPVVSNGQVGDVERIISDNRVGVIVDEKAAAMAGALVRLQALLNDSELSARCREAAVDHYALPGGVDRYKAAYEAALGREQAAGEK